MEEQRPCSEQAAILRHAYAEWIASVDAFRKLMGRSKFEPDGTAREADWVERVSQARGVESINHDRFIMQLDLYIDCLETRAKKPRS